MSRTLFSFLVIGTALVASSVVAQSATSSQEKDKSASERAVCPNKGSWEEKLVIHHIYVGQGDATFVRTPSGTTLLIDGGLPGSDKAVRRTLECYGETSLDYVVLTHPHADHFGGLIPLLKEETGIPVKEAIYDAGDTVKKNEGIATFTKYLAAADAAAARTKLGKRMIPPLGDEAISDRAARSKANRVAFSVVVADGQILNGASVAVRKGKDPINNNSVSNGIRITLGDFDYFTAGDLTGGGKEGKKASKHPDVETELSNQLERVTVFHANHHGSDSSNNNALLAKLQPELVIISAGEGGINKSKYRLPSEDRIVAMHALRSSPEIYSLSCGAGTAMPDHPDCALLDKKAVKQSQNQGLTRFRNAGGDLVLLVEPGGERYRVLSPQGNLRRSASAQ